MFGSSCYSGHFFKISLKVYTNKYPSTFRIHYLPQIQFLLPGTPILRKSSTLCISPWFGIIFAFNRSVSQVWVYLQTISFLLTQFYPWVYSTPPVINQSKSGFFPETWYSQTISTLWYYFSVLPSLLLLLPQILLKI